MGVATTHPLHLMATPPPPPSHQASKKNPQINSVIFVNRPNEGGTQGEGLGRGRSTQDSDVSLNHTKELNQAKVRGNTDQKMKPGVLRKIPIRKTQATPAPET